MFVCISGRLDVISNPVIIGGSVGAGVFIAVLLGITLTLVVAFVCVRKRRRNGKLLEGSFL